MSSSLPHRRALMRARPRGERHWVVTASGCCSTELRDRVRDSGRRVRPLPRGAPRPRRAARLRVHESAVRWARINFSWLASAYDTGAWAYRMTTMLQTVGGLVLALTSACLTSSSRSTPASASTGSANAWPRSAGRSQSTTPSRGTTVRARVPSRPAASIRSLRAGLRSDCRSPMRAGVSANVRHDRWSSRKHSRIAKGVAFLRIGSRAGRFRLATGAD
jgi:hypothetical protein